MAILSAEIEFRLSGGSGNSDPALSLGGAKSSTSATGSTLFDVVTGAESDSGDTEYRCIYVHNADPWHPVARQWMALHTRCYPMMAQRDRPVWDDVMQAQAAAGAAIIKQTIGA